jgi:hypothetical protein
MVSLNVYESLRVNSDIILYTCDKSFLWLLMCVPGGSDYQKQGVVMNHLRGTYALVAITASTVAANQLSVGMECNFYC